MKKLILILSLIGLIAVPKFGIAQEKGIIRGTVIDDANGEPMIGVTVLVKNTTQGMVTDLDGEFSIQMAPGTYNVQISFVSYETISVNDVVVEAGKVNYLGTIRMKESVSELQEVVVTAEAIKSSEAALMTVQKKSANLLDGISSETFRRIGDSDAAGAIKRVPGVSIQGGQYVYVRGLGDRYTKTILNGIEVPGLDPDRNALQIDIFPTSLMDNIVVYKTFTPDLPADMVGGVVDVEIKNFPEERIFSVSAGMEYTPGMHLIDNFLTYQGGSTDYIGLDDGTRDLPFDGETTDVPNPASNEPVLTDLTRSFDRTMASRLTSNLPNFNFGINAGNQFKLGANTLGYNAILNYSSKDTYFDGAVDAAYLKPANVAQAQLRADTKFEGPLGIRDVQLNGMLGVSFKTQQSKFNITALRLQNGIERSALRTRIRSLENFNVSQVTNLEYTERLMTSIIGSGEHNYATSGFEIKYKLGTTFSEINDKDVRITPFTINDDNGSLSINAQEGGEPNRIWRLLDEQNYVAKVDFTKKLDLFGNESKIKFGASNVYKMRDYEIQNFFLSFRGSQELLDLNGDPNQLLAPDNIWTTERGTGTYVQNGFNLSNAYEGTINTLAGYLSGELAFTDKLKTILGVRVEKYDQWYTGVNQAGSTPGNPNAVIYDHDKVFDLLQFFPSANLIYSVFDDSNLRLTYARTTARPSFKEKSTAEIQDVLTGRTFIGNIDLVQTDINNYDLRYEMFLERNQRFSVGAFYKTFENPIELVRQTANPNDIKPTNVGDAEIYGLEFELRKDFAFISPAFANFSFNTNITLTEASVRIDEEEANGRRQALREGEELEETRDFVGQPPYIINAALMYSNFESGLEAGLSYNVEGPTLAVVGIVRAPDTYTVPFHSMNFNVSKTFGSTNKNSVTVRVTNILNDIREQVFQSFNSDDFIETSRAPGTSFSIKYTRDF